MVCIADFQLVFFRLDLQRGIYAVQLKRWMDHFPLGESLMIISNERFQKETRQVMREILEFIGAPDANYFDDRDVSPTTRSVMDQNKGLKLLSVGGYDPMNNTTRKFLETFYKPYNKQLVELLGESWRPNW